MPTGFPDYYGGLTLPITVPEGGTGYTAVDAHALLVGNGSGKLNLIEPSTLGYVLTAQGSGADPAWAAPTVSADNFTGVLSIAHGGTGQSDGPHAADIVGILAIASGGTGESSPSLVAGTAISISGSWPDQTITNTSAYASLADPLPVAHGGTGTSTPALVAGTGISISGSWPGQTISSTSIPGRLEAGFVKIAAGSTSASTTFGTAFSNTPYTVLTPEEDLGTRRWWLSTVGQTSLTVTISSSDTVDHFWFYIAYHPLG